MNQRRRVLVNAAARPALWILSAGAALVLSACGGGASDDDASTVSSSTATSEVSFALDASPELPVDAAAQLATPAFHVAPLVLNDPGDADAADNTASTRELPHSQFIPKALETLSTRGLTLQAIDAQSRAHALSVGASGTATPAASTAAVTTYTPAQIRVAYGLPTLPSASVTPTAAQAAQQGAGQTIYIVDAMNDPNVAAELAAFNTKFGLPTCTTKAIAATTTLPLAAAASSAGCTLSVVYSTPSGTMTATAPPYNSGWATEIALDVQWAHATAPLARIVLIESADASLNGLLGGVKLANAMGAGTVSMSFGSNEGSWTSSVDSAFTASGMSYAAATGDNGSGVSWPAVSANVLAVGGTSLTWSGSGTRSESAWSLGGGGVSAYVATPSYQSLLVPGMGTRGHRAVADVSFNANPSTGQYVAVIAPGSAGASWLSAGGTSLSTPQWAGMIAVANAQRAQAGKAALGAPHATLYGQISTVPGTYAADFGDILSGSDGSCSTCAAKTGYDIPTGLGTPNASALLATLTGSTSTSATGSTSGSSSTPVTTTTTPTSTAPTITASTLTGVAGKALSGTIAFTPGSGSSLSISITGVPGGMGFTASGTTLTLSWPSPATGSYTLAVVATNASGLVTRASVPVTISAK